MLMFLTLSMWGRRWIGMIQPTSWCGVRETVISTFMMKILRRVRTP